MGNELGFEPRILSQPAIVAPGGMRQRNDPVVISPRAHRLADLFRCFVFQMVAMRICSDRKNKLELRRRLKKAVMPSTGTFGARRQVAARVVVPRKAKPH